MLAAKASTAAVATAAAGAAVLLAARYRAKHRAPARPAPSREPARPRHVGPASGKLWDLYARLFDLNMSSDPIGATMLGDNRFQDRLADVSLAGRQEHLHTLRALLAEARALDLGALPASEAQNYRFLVAMLELEIARKESFDRYEVPTTHLFGPHLYLPQLASLHPFRSTQDAQDYLTRLGVFPAQVDGMIQAFRAGAAAGVTLPQRSVEIMQQQCAASVPARLDDSPMFAPAAQLRALGVDPQRLSDLLRSSVFPAFERLRAFLADEYAAAARPNTGIGAHWPGGAALYDQAVAYYTSLPLTAVEVHRMGLREVARISAEMEGVKAAMGHADLPLADFVARMKSAPEYTPRGREEIVAAYEELLEEAWALLPRFFNTLPRAKCLVKAIEPFREKSAPPAHYYPAAKGQPPRPAVFYANTYKPETRQTYTFRAIALHEADPGHNAHLDITANLPNLPRVRQQANSAMTAMIEGWGLYTERLGVEMGFYPDDASNFGRLVTEQMRAVRLVVDTGLHALGWTRDEAIAYFARHVALGEEDIAAEVDRYMVFPGQAVSYKVGEIKLWELRRDAERRLGDAFDLKGFHDVLLTNGILPMAMVEELVNEWVESF